MTTAELRDSVNSLTAADRAMATVQLAKLIAKQSRILGEPIPDRVQRVLLGDSAALRPAH
jgi:hypothetical protein